MDYTQHANFAIGDGFAVCGGDFLRRSEVYTPEDLHRIAALCIKAAQMVQGKGGPDEHAAGDHVLRIDHGQCEGGGA